MLISTRLGSRISEFSGSKKDPEGLSLPQPERGAGDWARMTEEEQQYEHIFLSEWCSSSGAAVLEGSREEVASSCHLASKEDNDPAAVSQCSTVSSAKQSPGLDEERNIAFLLKELDTLRHLNKQLRDKLAMKEKELESRMAEAELRETQLEARACEKAGVLVEEIYKAQRERDQALMARLRLANEERDEALLRARRLQQALAEPKNTSEEEKDSDLEELLNRINIAQSGQGIERAGAVILDRLQKIWERRRRITAEEMNAVIEERDAALATCKRLEQDLHQVREQSQASANNSRHLTAENNQERAWKETLDMIKMERDRAVHHSQKLQEELRALRAYCSQQQSSSEEGNENERSQPVAGSSPEVGLQSAQLLEQLRLLAAEQRSTQAQLRNTQEAEREAKEKVHKLERLVEVLRKKVGTGSVRTVI